MRVHTTHARCKKKKKKKKKNLLYKQTYSPANMNYLRPGGSDRKEKKACISGIQSIFFLFFLNLQSSEVDCTQLGAHGLMYLLILCVLGNNHEGITISYLQRRLVAATDHCCALQLVPAPRRLTRMTPTLVRSAVCSLPSLFASILLQMYYTNQVKVLKAAVPSYVRDIGLFLTVSRRVECNL